MTCIAGVIHDGEVWIGADSWSGNEDNYFARKDPKIMRHSGMLIGFAGNLRVPQIVNHCVPDIEQILCPADIVSRWIPAVRAALIEHGAMKDDSGANELESAFLIGLEGRLFELCGDFSLHEHEAYAAVGTGDSIAYGVLYAVCEHFKLTTAFGGRNIVEAALKAAAAHNAKVCAPFSIHSL
jgi:ATP-dependent protease HslVU (ClpYQ) peptidase subunit